MVVTASQLRQNIYRLLDEVFAARRGAQRKAALLDPSTNRESHPRVSN